MSGRPELAVRVGGTPEPLFSITAEGRVVSWNRRAELLLGQPRAQAIGRYLLTLVADRDAAQELPEAIADALLEGEAWWSMPRAGAGPSGVALNLQRQGEQGDHLILFLEGHLPPARVEPARELPPPPKVQVEPADALLLKTLEEVRSLAQARACVLRVPGHDPLRVGEAGGPAPTDVSVEVPGERPAGVQLTFEAVTAQRAEVEAYARMVGAALRIVEERRAEARRHEAIRALRVRMSQVHAPEGVARAAVGAAVPTFADWCAVDLLRDGTQAERVAVEHVDPAGLRALQALALRHPDAPAPAGAGVVLQSSLPLIQLEAEPADAPRDGEPETAHLLRALGTGSFMILPLRTRGRLLGAITLARGTGRAAFDGRDAEWAQAFADLLAVGVENRRLLDHVQRAQQASHEATQRYRRLQALTTELSGALTPTDVTRAVVNQAMHELEVVGGAISLVSSDQKTVEVAGSLGEAGPLTNGRHSVAYHDPLPLTQAIRQSQVVVLDGLASAAGQFPHLAHAPASVQGLLVVPILAQSRPIGSLGLCFGRGRRPTPASIEFAQTLAAHAADALERARLYDSTRRARVRSEADHRRSELLSSASRALSSSFDSTETLQQVARLVTQDQADWCAMFLTSGEGDIHAIAAAHRDPERSAECGRLLKLPAHPAAGSLRRVLEGAHTEFLADVPPAAQAQASDDPPTLQCLQAMGLRTQLILPLHSRGRMLGAMMLGNARLRHYVPDDMRALEELARRIALALDNGHLYRLNQAALAALRDSEERYRLLVEGVRDHAIFALDTDGRVANWNEGAARLYGRDAGSAMGRPLHEFYRPAETSAAEAHLETARREGRHEEEAWRMRGDGAPFFASVVLTALHDDAGRLRGYSVVTRDLTERHRAREELEEVRRRVALREKLSTMGTLVSGVAHEIRTPLTIISNSLHLIRHQLDKPTPDAGALRRHGDLALEGVERINGLVQDLRRFRRMEGLGRTSASLDTVVEEALQLFQAAHRGQIQLETDLRPTRHVDVDVAQIQQAILNLLQNAFEAMPHGGRIRVTTCQEGERATLRISDTGSGIPPEVLPRIFEEFYTTKREGTGLGLSIVRRVVEIHHGQIDCQSRPGEGTTFTLRLATAP